MVDKYTVRSVTTPAFPSGLQYHDSYSDWTILELFPYHQPGTVMVGGIVMNGYQILIPPATNERLKPAKGDVIELSMAIARVGAQIPPISQHPMPGTMHGMMEEIIAQLKRLNDNMERKQ